MNGKIHAALALAAVMVAGITDDAHAAGPPLGRQSKTEFRVPYDQIEATNQIVVRAKINGVGPYNFVLDNAAPVLFIEPNLARVINLVPNKDNWVDVRKIEIEGGPVVENVKARVESHYQTKGINSAGVVEVGREVYGVIGYSIIARFRIEIDYTRPYMLWQKLEFEPPSPVRAMESAPGTGTGQGSDLFAQAMAQAQVISELTASRRPPPQLRPGYLGIEFDAAAPPAKIANVLKGSPAERAGLRAGDIIAEFASRPVRSPDEIARLTPRVSAGQRVTLKIQRKDEILSVTITAANGL